MALRASKKIDEDQHLLRVEPSQSSASADTNTNAKTDPTEPEWLIPLAKNVYDYAKYRADRARAALLAEPQDGTTPDVKFVKTGMSSAPPPCFLTAPLLLKSDPHKEELLQHFFHDIKSKAKIQNFLGEPSDEVNSATKLRIIPKDEKDPTEPGQFYPHLSIKHEESLAEKDAEEKTAREDLKKLLGKLVVGLERSRKKQLQEAISLKEEVVGLESSRKKQLQEAISLKEEVIDRESSHKKQLQEAISLKEELIGLERSRKKQLQEAISLKEEVIGRERSHKKQLQEAFSLKEELIGLERSHKKQLQEAISLKEELKRLHSVALSPPIIAPVAPYEQPTNTPQSKLLIGLENSLKIQLQETLFLKEELKRLRQVPISPSVIAPVPLYEQPTNIPQSKRPLNKPPVRKNKLNQFFLKELNKTMKKMSIVGLFLGILLLGLLFFFIGFLASYSNLKGQQKECPPPPTSPIFSDTIMEEKGATSAPQKETKKDTKEAKKETKEAKKDTKVDFTKLAKEAVDMEVNKAAQKILPTSGPLGTIAGGISGAVIGPQAAGKSGGQRLGDAAERIALNRLTRGGASSQMALNSLPVGIRPFAQQAEQQLHRPDHPSLAPKAAALRGPFAPKRFGTIPPAAPRENLHVEPGYGRGTLQDAYRQRYGASGGTRPHVPKPVFAPIVTGNANVSGNNTGAAIPPPALMPMVQPPYPQNAYPQGGYPGNAYGEAQPPMEQQNYGTQPYYTAPMAPAPMYQMPEAAYPPQGPQAPQGVLPQYPQYGPGYAPGYPPEYGAAYAPGYPSAPIPGYAPPSHSGGQPRRLIGMG